MKNSRITTTLKANLPTIFALGSVFGLHLLFIFYRKITGLFVP